MAFFTLDMLSRVAAEMPIPEKYLRNFDPDVDSAEQAGDNWCWLAVAVFVAKHLQSNRMTMSGEQEQCEIAKDTFTCADCGRGKGCDKPFFIETAFRKLCKRKLVCVGLRSEIGGPTEDEVIQEIGVSDRPIILRIQDDPDNSFHYVVVVGYGEDSLGSAVPILMDPAGQFGGPFPLNQLIHPFCQERVFVD